MKLPGVFKSLGKLALNQVKTNPKATAILVGTIVGGAVGTKIKKVVEKLPSD